MPNDWLPWLAFARQHRRFLIATHVRPDGDALGSQLALALALEATGADVLCVLSSSLPPRYAFLDPDRRLHLHTPGDNYADRDAAIVVDTGTFNQLDTLGPWMKATPAAKFVIDHHATQDELGGRRLVDTSAEACGRLVLEAIDALGVSLTERMATLLFTAVAMDTGWFRHANTQPATFTLAARLQAAGATPGLLYDELFDKATLARLHLSAKALERARTSSEGRVAYTEVHLTDYAATGAVPLDTEDLINYPRSITGTQVALLFIEQPEGGVKVSFRSRRVNVARVAEQFGGGGHKLAAGARLAGHLPDVRAAVLAAVDAALIPSEPAT